MCEFIQYLGTNSGHELFQCNFFKKVYFSFIFHFRNIAFLRVYDAIFKVPNSEAKSEGAKGQMLPLIVVGRNAQRPI